MCVRQRRLAGIAFLCCLTSLPAQTPLSPDAVKTLVSDAVRFQLEDMAHPGWAVRYRVHRMDGKEDSIRDLVETSDGNVGRTLQRHGRRLTPDEDEAEQQRLRVVAANPAHRHRGASGFDSYGKDLVSAMPSAMVYTPVPDQPQLQGVAKLQTVLAFEPRPGFRPASTAQGLLTGIAGRIWVDEASHHLLRLELHITKDLNVALGLLARVYQGGTVQYQQLPLGNGHDSYSSIAVDVTLRELMVHTVPYHLSLQASDVSLLPQVPTLQQGVDLLLTAPAALQP